MEHIMPFIKLLTVFGFMILLLRLKVDIGIVILGGAFALGLLFGMNFLNLLKVSARASVEFATIRLLLIVIFLRLLSGIMAQTGALKRIELASRMIFRDIKWGLAAIPALIGLMPMPAGALVSAPMIEPMADRLNLSKTDRTLVNYWFRHIWEYSWPLYQGLIIAAAMISSPVRAIIVRQLPLSLLMVFIGYFFILKRFKSEQTSEFNLKTGLKELAIATYPILVILALSIIGKLDLLYGSLIAVISAILPYFKALDYKKLLKRGVSLKIVVLILSVMIFKKVLQVSGAISTLPRMVAMLNLPDIVAVAATPFVVGILTGISFAYVGISFPLILTMITGNWANFMVAYLAGFTGVLLSPVHLCLVLSADYYGASLKDVYNKLVWPVTVTFVIGLIYAVFFGRFF